MGRQALSISRTCIADIWESGQTLYSLVIDVKRFLSSSYPEHLNYVFQLHEFYTRTFSGPFCELKSENGQFSLSFTQLWKEPKSRPHWPRPKKSSTMKKIEVTGINFSKFF